MRSLAYSMTIVAVLLCLSASADAVGQMPFELTIKGPESVTIGNEINVNAVLKNISKRTVSVTKGLPYAVFVRDSSGRTIQKKPGQWVYFGSAEVVSLGPGNISVQNVIVSGKYGDYDLTKPGKYVVRLQRAMGDAGYPKGAMLESNEITITVLPKKAHGVNR